MLTFSESQLDALRIPVHKGMRARLLSRLGSAGAVEDLSGPEPAIAIADRETGAKSRLVFRADGLPSRIESAANRSYKLDYDQRGLLTSIAIPSRTPYRFQYSKDASLEAASYEGADPYRFQHDKRGEITSVAWPDKRKLTFERHSNGKVSRFTDRAGAVTEYTYDDFFRLKTVSGPLGRTLEFIPEPEQGRFTLVYPNGARESVEWIPGAHRFLRKMPGGTTIEYSLDSKNRVTQIAWPGGGRAQFRYVEGDALESVQYGAEFVRYTRDSSGNVASEETATGKALSIYDRQGRLLQLVSPFGDTFAYTYDPDGFVTSISAWNRTIRFTPGKDGQTNEIWWDGNIIERRKYGPLGRVEEAQIAGPQGAVLSRQSYRYDECERLTDLRDYDPINGFSRHLSYDAEDRLVADEGKRLGGTFRYDARGNLKQVSGGAAPESIEYGPMDEPVRAGARQMKYDPRGNAAEWESPRGALKCRYDERGLMTHCVVGGRVVEFIYDALGRRIGKSSSAGVWRFGWFGLQLLWEEFKAPGAAAVRRDYLYVPGTFTVIAFRENDRVYWVQNDVRGAVIRVFDEAGAVVWYGAYESFGRVQVHGKRIRQPLRLMGQYEDEETGLYYNLARYYSPDLRSYLAKDPRWYEPWGTSYSYSRNDPWNRADPIGTLPSFISDGLNAAGSALSAAAGAVSSAVSQATSAVGSLVSSVASDVTSALSCIPCALKSLGASLLPGIIAAGNWCGSFLSGFFDTTIGPLIQVVLHPLATLEALGHAIAHPIDTAIAIKNAVVATTTAALSGDPKALGEVTGTIVSAVLTAGAAKAASSAIKGAKAAEVTAAASDAGDAVKLSKSLASAQQMGETGTPIIGSGTGKELLSAERLAQQYGGDAGDWAKMTSSNYTASDGASFETHWYENTATGQKVEFKTKLTN